MQKATSSLRHDHEALIAGLENLRSIADSMFLTSVEAANEELEEAYFFLSHALLPHADAEEEVLYPLVARLTGSQELVRTMMMDHSEIRRLAEELGGARLTLSIEPLEHKDRKLFRRLLYSLYAISQLHLAKEEKILQPLLVGRLSDMERTRLENALEAATRRRRVLVI